MAPLAPLTQPGATVRLDTDALPPSGVVGVVVDVVLVMVAKMVDKNVCEMTVALAVTTCA